MKLVASLIPYLVGGALCFLLVPSRPSDCTPRSAGVQIRAWKIMGFFVLLLALLRPFEVHSQITEALRTSAMTSGWYEQRGAQQMNLLYVGGLLMAVLATFILFEARRWHPATILGILATFYLAGLATLNILSLHALDALLGRAPFGISLRWMLDMAGLVALVGAAFRFGKAVRGN